MVMIRTVVRTSGRTGRNDVSRDVGSDTGEGRNGGKNVSGLRCLFLGLPYEIGRLWQPGFSQR